MTEIDVQPYIDDILAAINDSSKEVSRKELENEFKKFLEYGVPLDHAKQTLIKKFGGTPLTPSVERSLLIDLEPNQNTVSLLCRVITINPKDITVKGTPKKIFYGIVADESGSVPFTAWTDFDIQKGDVLEISNAYTKEWQGTIQVNLGDRTKLTKTDASRLSSVTMEPKEYKVKDLKSGLGSVELTARILKLIKREVMVEKNKKMVFSGVLADETGKAQFTSWHDFNIKEEDVVKIKGGYVKSWKGIPQLTFDEKASVSKVDAKTIPKQEITSQQLPLHELVDRFGALDVEVEGTVLRIREGSGIIQRCPECSRVLRNDECSVHGKVQGTTDLRIKLDLDDGTGTVSGVLGKEVTEKLLGHTMEELQKIADQSDTPSLLDTLESYLFTHKVTLRGNALGDTYGIQLIAQEARLKDYDIVAEAAQLTKECEELL